MTDNKNTILYQNKEYSIGTNRELYNPYNKPLTDIVYELAKELESWKLQATSLNYADTICALEIDLEHKNQECEELKSHVLTRCPECNSEYLSPVGAELYDENKRLKAENEEWKKANDEKNELLAKLGCPTTATAKMKAHCLQKQLDKLKAENEQYKEEIMLLRKGYDEEDCTKTCPNMQVYEKEMKQAEQKLVRIGDIAEKDINFCLKCNGGKEIDCIDCIEGGRALLAKEILQIIDEVE